MNDQSSLINKLDRIVLGVGILFLFLFPLATSSMTTEFVTYNKFILVHLTAVLLLLIWAVRTAVARKITTVRTPYDAFFFLIAVAFALSTWFSVSPYTSLFGELNVWHWTISEFLSFTIITYVLLTAVRSTRSVGKLIVAFLASTSLVAFIGLGTYLNLFDGFSDSSGLLQLLSIDGFSLAGNAYSFIYLMGAGALVEGYILYHSLKKDTEETLFPFIPLSKKVLATLSTIKLSVMLLAIVAWAGAVIPGIPNRVDFPASMSWDESWRVASSAIRDYPFLGTGPSTYDVAYRGYRSAAPNLTESWNVAFNRSGSEYLTWLTTMGVAGFAALLLFVVRLAIQLKRQLYSGDDVQPQIPYQEASLEILRTPLAIILAGTLVLWLFLSSTVTIIGVFFSVLLLWLLLDKLSQDPTVQEVDINLGNIASMSTNNIAVPPSKSVTTEGGQYVSIFVAILVALIAVITGYYVMQDLRSNIIFARSIRSIADNGSVVDIYDAQRVAVRLNPYRDAYRRSYANTNIATAQLIAAERGESLTDTERQEVLSLVQQGIREARVVSERINRFKATNWQVRGRVYQSLLGVARGADQWALQAYQQAIVLAPNDPQLRIDLGSFFLSLAVNAPADDGQVGEEPGEDVPETPDTRTTNLVRAEAALRDAVRLKPDLANAHFNLALVYREAERYDLATAAFEQTLRLLDAGDQGYTQAQQLLEEVKELAPTPTPQEQITPTPTPTTAEQAAEPTLAPEETGN